jgi:exodeoxyribonuclease V beta subunit
MSAAVRYLKPAALARLGSKHAVVEASAGTGKTYILEHLVVDLLLTRGARLDEILVVTFTEKATAELIHRVRAKLQELKDLVPGAPRAAPAEAPDEACWIIDERARRRLREALFSFDRASIFTIHGFCQRLLSEHAFLHRRLFDEENVDEREAFHAAFAEALRRDIAASAALQPWLGLWLQTGRGLTQLEDVLWRCSRELACLHPPRPEALEPGPLDEAAFAAALRAFPAVADEDAACAAWLRANKVHGGSIRKVVRTLAGLSAVAESFRRGGDLPRALAQVDLLDGKDGELFEYLQERIGHLAAAGEGARLLPALRALALLDRPFVAEVAHRLLPAVSARFEARKREAGLYDFQDMLTLVARSLEGDGPRQRALLATLRGRYRHALIDEFQDTDEVQWAIFRRIFFESPDGHVLTVIGDPKQAIYGFRGADVQTYLRARREIEEAGGERVPISANFRSTAAVIAGYNAVLDQAAPFFRPAAGILYDPPVTCGRPQLALTDAGGRPAPAVVVLDVETREKALLTWQVKRVLQARMVAELQALLGGSLSFGDASGARPLRAGDVFILTRTVRESREIGEVLRAARIPFAFYKQERLFQTVEAREVLDLLRAIAEPEDRSARARAFITPFFGLSLPELAACDDLDGSDAILRLLHEWKALADEGDFEGLFARIVEDSGIVCRELFLRQNERALTNYLHVLEILQEEAARSRATIRELAQTLGAYVAGTRKPPGEGRDIQRLESDADAVQIMTIHHAKGLEAAVVFLYGGLWRFPRNEVRVVHDGQGRRVVRVGRASEAEKQQHEDEQEDEERRVLYVALTRAKARLYLPRFPAAFKNKVPGCYRFINERLHTLLGGFTPEATRALFTPIPLPCPGEPAPVAQPAPPAALAGWQPAPALLAAEAPDEETGRLARERAGFLLTSYSAVKRVHGGFVPAADTLDPAAGEAGALEADALGLAPADELPRGRLSGSFLHEVIELLPLETLVERPPLEAWQELPAVAALFERMRRRHDRSPAHLPHARRLVHTALTARVRLGAVELGGLATAAHPTRELEFLYPIPEQAHALLGTDHHPTPDGPAWRIERGVVKGFIDFLFEHQGRVYVCDWKGDWLPGWEEARLAAHCERNYAIQAQLYTLAALRLCGLDDEAAFERRFGGVLYCFLRGMSAGDPTAGVFFRRPRWSEILGWQGEMLGPSYWGLG